MNPMDQVQAFINQVATQVGVQGAFIFDRQGAIKQYSTPMKLPREQGLALAGSLSRTLAGLSTVQNADHLDLDLVYDEGRLVIKGFGTGALCIACERQVNYSLINLALQQGLGLLRTAATSPETPEQVQIPVRLKEIALEVLGEYAVKVLPILESAGTDRDKLVKAIEQAENLTRMFIDKNQAGDMAQRMRQLLRDIDGG